ncbi:MAG: hypothetical protein RL404_990 [Pseudomonadota bacterium]|jgi:hypothetical protein
MKAFVKHRDNHVQQGLRSGTGRSWRRAALAVATSVVAALALGWMPLPAQAETLETNNPDIVVKRVYCVDYGLGGVLVNRSGKPFRGQLAVAVTDDEGDVVGRGKQRLRVGAANGARFAYYYINTLDCRSHHFEFTVN